MATPKDDEVTPQQAAPQNAPQTAPQAGPEGVSPPPASSEAGAAEVDPRLLEILVCPLTKTRLRYDRERRELVSKAAGLAYPIRDGVPMMTMEAARQLDDP